jgi:hypothetical protein
MKDDDTQPAKDSIRAKREKRLAEALRANLRRRKGRAGVQPSANSSNSVGETLKRTPESDKGVG